MKNWGVCTFTHMYVEGDVVHRATEDFKKEKVKSSSNEKLRVLFYTGLEFFISHK